MTGRTARARSGAGSGFTLLEMLCALALTSVLAGSLYASLSTGFRARRSAERVLAKATTSVRALELTRADIESALPPAGILAGAFIGDNAAGSSGDSDTLSFHAAAVADESDERACGMRRVELLLADDGDGGRNLVRRITTNLLATVVPEASEQVLCRNVCSLNIEYYDGLEWLDTWDSATLEGELPTAVKLTLGLPADSGGRAGESDDEQTLVSRIFTIAARPPEARTATGGGR